MSDADRAVLEWIGKADWGDVPAWITAIVAGAAAFFALRQIRETSRASERERRPVVVLTIELGESERTSLYFRIKNEGAGVARDVKVRMVTYPELSSMMTDWPFWNAKFFDQSFPVMGPGQEISTYADSAHVRLRADQKNMESEFSAEVTYESQEGTPYSDVFPLDLHILEGTMYSEKSKTNRK